MKTRYVVLIFGLAFAVTLAVIVGQRLSSEAMAVIVGVIAGVAASIPTSLIVVWVATRSAIPRAAPVAMRPSERPEPRIVVMAAPASAASPLPASYQTIAGYPPEAYQPAYAGYAAPPALPARRFTVIGGAEVSAEDFERQEAYVWQH